MAVMQTYGDGQRGWGGVNQQRSLVHIIIIIIIYYKHVTPRSTEVLYVY